jgi:hypothetical protein
LPQTIIKLKKEKKILFHHFFSSLVPNFNISSQLWGLSAYLEIRGETDKERERERERENGIGEDLLNKFNVLGIFIVN